MTASTSKLGDVCELFNGGAWNQTEYTDDGIPVVQVSNMKNGTIDISGLKFISPSSYDRYKKHTFKEDDLVIATVGSHATQASAAGRATIVRGFAAGMLLNQNAVAIRSKSELLDQRYLGLVGRSEKFQSYLGAVGQGAANQVRIALSAIKEYSCDFPALSSQRRIVDVVSAYDDLIENNRRRVQLLEQAARLLYKEWFVHLRFPGHEHIKIKGGVPEGWGKVLLSEMCMDIRESVNSSDLPPDVPYIGLEHIPRRSITLNEWRKACEVDSNKFKFAEGDILFGKIRPYFHKVGFTLIDGIASSDAIVIRPIESRLHYYVLFLLSSDEFVTLASKTVREGSKMPRADWKFLLKSEFRRPSAILLELFSETVKPIHRQLRNLALQNQQLAHARDLLLPHLMNGEGVA